MDSATWPRNTHREAEMTEPVRTCCRCKTTQDVWYNVIVPIAEPWPQGWAPMCKPCLEEGRVMEDIARLVAGHGRHGMVYRI